MIWPALVGCAARMVREQHPGTLDYVSLHPGYVLLSYCCLLPDAYCLFSSDNSIGSR
jgi:hypothetical protein